MITIVNSRFKTKPDQQQKDLFRKYSDVRHRIKKQQKQTLVCLQIQQYYLLAKIMYAKKHKLELMQKLEGDLEKKRQYKELVYSTLYASNFFIQLNSKAQMMNSKVEQLVNRIRENIQRFLMINNNQKAIQFKQEYIYIVKKYYQLTISQDIKKLIKKYKLEDHSFHYRLLLRQHFNMLMVLSKNNQKLHQLFQTVDVMREKQKIQYKCNVISYRFKVLYLKQLRKSKRLRQVLLQLSRIHFYLLTGKRTYDENNSRFQYLLEFKFHFLRLQSYEYQIEYFSNQTDVTIESPGSSKTPTSFRRKYRMINNQPTTPRVSSIQTLQNPTNILYEAIITKINKIFQNIQQIYIYMQKTKVLTKQQAFIKSNQRRLILLTKIQIKSYEILHKKKQIIIFNLKTKKIKQLFNTYLTTIKIYPSYKKIARKQVEYVICGILMLSQLEKQITNKTIVITLDTPFRIPQKLGLQAQKQKISFYLKLIKAQLIFVQKVLKFSSKIDYQEFESVDKLIENHQFIYHFQLYEQVSSQKNIFKHIQQYRSAVLDFIAFIYDYLNVMILKNQTFSSFRQLNLTEEQLIFSFIEKNKYQMLLLQEIGDLKDLLGNIFCTIFTVVVLYDPVFVQREASFFPEIIDQQENFRVYSGW